MLSHLFMLIYHKIKIQISFTRIIVVDPDPAASDPK
jgi:hypothetical protein